MGRLLSAVRNRLRRIAGPAGAEAAAEGRGPVTVGGYLIQREIGHGAFGAVYLGSDPETGKPAAIKTLDLSRHRDSASHGRIKERFLREAAMVALLAHPAIVVIYGAGEEGDLAYIAMEVIGGGSLDAWTKPGRLLPLPVLAGIMARVADALDYAHRHRVVHRDVKPANIMVDLERDVVKITDFGVATLLGEAVPDPCAFRGTPAYMAPEQLGGPEVDGRADLYSLGVTLFQLCTGRLPFFGDSVAELMYKIANEEAPAITAADPALPARLAAIVGRCLAKDPRARYQSGAELAEDLREWDREFNNKRQN